MSPEARALRRFARDNPDEYRRHIEGVRFLNTETALTKLAGQSDEEIEAVFQRMRDEQPRCPDIVEGVINRIKAARRQVAGRSS